ncbi:STAS domain-containing protein [Streptomyces asoensis]|uniref:STAS domain-containing protein n=1 Tax=Streptomyces asoensis TaxID=249586 RepID=UPI00167B9794|nr:STAS domain-containing protein [Streptomyces asoensis]
MTDSHKDDTPDQCRITCAVVEGVRVVTAQGEIDHDATRAFNKSLLSANGTLAHRRIVADLSGVTFMDASGVNVLIAAYRQVTGTEGWLRIAGAQPSVLRVLQTVGVDAFIPCLPTTEQALNS